MNPITKSRVELLKACLQTASLNKDIIADLAEDWRITPKSIVRLVKIARRQMDEDERQKKEIINKVRAVYIANVAKDDIISELEADVALCNIIRGITQLEKPFNTPNGVATIKAPPGHSDILKALHLFYKRFGSYSAVKKENEKERINYFPFEDKPEMIP